MADLTTETDLATVRARLKEVGAVRTDTILQLCDEVERLRTIVRSVNRIISQNEIYRWKVERIVAALGSGT